MQICQEIAPGQSSKRRKRQQRRQEEVEMPAGAGYGEQLENGRGQRKRAIPKQSSRNRNEPPTLNHNLEQRDWYEEADGFGEGDEEEHRQGSLNHLVHVNQWQKAPGQPNNTQRREAERVRQNGQGSRSRQRLNTKRANLNSLQHIQVKRSLKTRNQINVDSAVGGLNYFSSDNVQNFAFVPENQRQYPQNKHQGSSGKNISFNRNPNMRSVSKRVQLQNVPQEEDEIPTLKLEDLRVSDNHNIHSGRSKPTNDLHSNNQNISLQEMLLNLKSEKLTFVNSSEDAVNRSKIAGDQQNNNQPRQQFHGKPIPHHQESNRQSKIMLRNSREQFEKMTNQIDPQTDFRDPPNTNQIQRRRRLARNMESKKMNMQIENHQGEYKQLSSNSKNFLKEAMHIENQNGNGSDVSGDDQNNNRVQNNSNKQKVILTQPHSIISSPQTKAKHVKKSRNDILMANSGIQDVNQLKQISQPVSNMYLNINTTNNTPLKYKSSIYRHTQQLERQNKYAKNPVDLKQFRSVTDYMNSLKNRTSSLSQGSHTRINYQDARKRRPLKYGQQQSGHTDIQKGHFNSRDSIITQLSQKNTHLYSHHEHSQSGFPKQNRSGSHWQFNTMRQHRSQLFQFSGINQHAALNYKNSYGGSVRTSIVQHKVKPSKLCDVNDELEISSGVSSSKSCSAATSEEVQELLDEKFQSISPKIQNKPQKAKPNLKDHRRQSTLEAPSQQDDSWKKLKFYDEPDFDPVQHMSKVVLKCRKYNYSIPESYGSSIVVLKYSCQTDTLEVYNVDHLCNKSDNDDGNSILRAGRQLFELNKQQLSIPMRDINGFIYGPFSTRFYMMRMGINQLIIDNSWKTKYYYKNQEKNRRNNRTEKLSSEELELQKKQHKEWQNCLPFFAWNCITLQMGDRDLDLVFNDDESVKIFILFLIMKLETYNGIRGSLNSLRKQNIINPKIHTRIMMQKIFFNFFVMKIRMKMSYEACVQHRTLKELLLIAILKAYQHRNKQGLVQYPYPNITKRMLHRVRNLCFTDISSVSILKEAEVESELVDEEKDLSVKIPPKQYKKSRNKDLQRNSQQLTTMKSSTIEQKNAVAITNFLQQTLLSKDDIDDLFQQYINSDDSRESGINDDQQLYVKREDMQTGPDNQLTTNISRAARSPNKQQKPIYVDTCENSDKKNMTQHELMLEKRRHLFRKKFNIHQQLTRYSKIMLLVKMRVLKGPLFIYALLECIKLRRKILFMELESGRETEIPYEFNIKQYPCCFQYYDCLIEVICRNFTIDQKRLLQSDHHRKYGSTASQMYRKLLLSTGSKDKSLVSIAKPKKLSMSEILGKEIKSFFSKDDKQDPRNERVQEYKSYLRLFNKAENIQNGRYIQLNKLQMRKSNPNMEGYQRFLTEVNESDYNKDQQGLRYLSYTTYEDMGDVNLDPYITDQNNEEDWLIDLNYLTQQQVGRKRQDLFVKKIQYQNQLMALKHKGKRLLMCERLDAQTIDQTEEFLNKVSTQNEDVQQESSGRTPRLKSPNSSESIQQFSDEELRNFVQYLESFQDKFEKKSVVEQEYSVIRHRAKLIKGILSRRNFSEINRYVDKKIKYDQRFFQKGYKQYQQFMSDIRKQIRLNEQIIYLNNNIKYLQGQLNQNNHKIKTTLSNATGSKDRKREENLARSAQKIGSQLNVNKKSTPIPDKQILINQLKDKRKQLLTIRNNENEPELFNSYNDEDRQEKLLSKDSSNKQHFSGSKKQKNREKMDPELEKDTDNWNSGVKRMIETPKLNQSIPLRIKKGQSRRQSAKKSSNQTTLKCCDKLDSDVDSSFPSLDSESESANQTLNSMEQIHKNVTCDANIDLEALKNNQIYQNLKKLAKEATSQASSPSDICRFNNLNSNLFKKLAYNINQLDDESSTKKKISQLQSTVQRKRARIFCIQNGGQKTLWGRDGSYEPADVYKLGHFRRYSTGEQDEKIGDQDSFSQ